MQTATATIKGQVVIPAALRKKLKITKGTRLSVMEQDGKIIMEPLSDDPIVKGRGMFPSQGEILQCLLNDRTFESAK